jgi:ABC-2 type transport system ATP-binding protein
VGEAAIEARGLVKSYGEKRALDGVDLDVARGSVCALLGPNGAGKTTAVRVLTTLTNPDAGTATVAGCDVIADPLGVRRNIGLAAQDATVDELLTGRENLILVGELRALRGKRARARADELLEQFALTDASDKLVRDYSGGMRRRLDLAATLVARPSVLFLDEPTTGLDPRGRNDLWEVLDTLVSEGTTILLTTQYLDEADRLANDIVVVDHGRVIARGDSLSLKRQVGGDQLHVVCSHHADVARTAELVAGIAGSTPSIDEPARTVTTPVDDGVRLLGQLAQALTAAGIAVDDLSLGRPTLDDVFLTLTGGRAEHEVAA